jgi:hypothetical protein
MPHIHVIGLASELGLIDVVRRASFMESESDLLVDAPGPHPDIVPEGLAIKVAFRWNN